MTPSQRSEKVAAGTCAANVRCRRKATHGQLCQAHRARQRENGRKYDQKVYNQRRAAGLCTFSSACNARPVDGKANCPEHQKVREAHFRKPEVRKRHNKSVAKYRQTMRELGICQNCGQAEIDEGISDTYCRPCRLENAEALRADARAKGVPVTTRKCQLCRERGHRASTCPRRGSVDDLRIEDFATARMEVAA